MRVLLTGAAGFIGSRDRRPAGRREVTRWSRVDALHPGGARRRRDAPTRTCTGSTSATRRPGPTCSTGSTWSATRRRWSGAGVDGRPTCRRTPATTTSAPRPCSPRCTRRGVDRTRARRRRWWSTARAATPAPSTATQPPGPARRAASTPGDFENHCPRCGRDARRGSWSTRTRGSTRAAATPRARSRRSTTPRRGPGRPAARAIALRYHNVYGPGMPRDTPYSGVAAIFRSSLERGRAAAGLRGRRPDARLRARRTTSRAANVLAIDAVVERDRPESFAAYNVCSGHAGPDPATSPAGRAERRRRRARRSTGDYRPGDVRHVVASPERARRELGLHRAVAPGRGARGVRDRPAPLTAAGRHQPVSEQVLHEQRQQHLERERRAAASAPAAGRRTAAATARTAARSAPPRPCSSARRRRATTISARRAHEPADHRVPRRGRTSAARRPSGGEPRATASARR